jgi:hypothetical protein
VLEVVEDPLPALLLVGGSRAGAGGLRRHGSGWLLRFVSAERGRRVKGGSSRVLLGGERETTERVSNFERLKRAPLLLRRGRRRLSWEKRIRRVYGAATATAAFLGGCQVGPLLCFFMV